MIKYPEEIIREHHEWLIRFNEACLKGAEAGRNLRRELSRLIDPSEKACEFCEFYGLDLDFKKK